MWINKKDILATGWILWAASYFEVPAVAETIWTVAKAATWILSAPIVWWALGFWAWKLFWASNETSTWLWLTSAWYFAWATKLWWVAIAPYLLAGWLWTIFWKQAWKFLDLDEKQQRNLSIVSWLAAVWWTAAWIWAMPLLMWWVALTSWYYAYDRLLKPWLTKAYKSWKNWLKNTVDWTTWAIKNTANVATLGMFNKKLKPETVNS